MTTLPAVCIYYHDCCRSQQILDNGVVIKEEIVLNSAGMSRVGQLSTKTPPPTITSRSINYPKYKFIEYCKSPFQDDNPSKITAVYDKVRHYMSTEYIIYCGTWVMSYLKTLCADTQYVPCAVIHAIVFEILSNMNAKDRLNFYEKHTMPDPDDNTRRILHPGAYYVDYVVQFLSTKHHSLLSEIHKNVHESSVRHDAQAAIYRPITSTINDRTTTNTRQ